MYTLLKRLWGPRPDSPPRSGEVDDHAELMDLVARLGQALADPQQEGQAADAIEAAMQNLTATAVLEWHRQRQDGGWIYTRWSFEERMAAADQLRRWPLLALLTLDPNGYVRSTALFRLVKMGVPWAVPFIVLRTGDWVLSVRQMACAAVAAVLETAPEAIMRAFVLVEAVGDWRPETAALRDRIVEVLRQRPDLVASALEDMAESSNRALVIFALEHLPSRGLLDRAIESTDRRVHRSAVTAALMATDSGSRAGLIRIGESGRVDERRRACIRLAETHDPALKDFLVRRLMDKSHSVRSVAQYHLAKHHAFDVVAFYREAALEPWPSAAAFRGLMETAPNEAKTRLRDRLQRRDCDHAAIVRALAWGEGAEAAHTLRLRLLDASTSDTACAALCRLGIEPPPAFVAQVLSRSGWSDAVRRNVNRWMEHSQKRAGAGPATPHGDPIDPGS